MQPLRNVRAAVYARDGFRCAACGEMRGLSFQHRRAVGMGGSKVLVSAVDGLTLCGGCNVAVEGAAQRDALRFGWKVRRWVRDPGEVPVFYWPEGKWFRLVGDVRVRVGVEEALAMMRRVYGKDDEGGGR